MVAKGGAPRSAPDQQRRGQCTRPPRTISSLHGARLDAGGRQGGRDHVGHLPGGHQRVAAGRLDDRHRRAARPSAVGSRMTGSPPTDPGDREPDAGLPPSGCGASPSASGTSSPTTHVDLDVRARRGPCAAGRERRRQDDAHAHPLRPHAPRRGRDRGRRPAGDDPLAARRDRGGHRHGHPALLAGRAHDRRRERRRSGGRSGLRLDLGAAPEPSSARPSPRSGIAVDPDARVADLSVGRAAAGRDRQGARPRLPRPHPRRADRGARARRRWRPCSRRCAGWSPKGSRSCSSATSSARCARSPTASACSRRGRSWARAPGDTDERELARMMVGRPTFGVARGDGRRTVPASRRVLRVDGLSARRTPGPAGASRRSTSSVRRGRDRRASRACPATARPSWWRCCPACAGRRRGASRSASVELAGAGPADDDGGGRRAHPRGPPREPRAGPVGRAQPRARAHRRLPVRAGPRRAPHRARTRATLIERFAIRARPRRPGRGPCRAATSRRCCWRGCCRGSRG